jgi:RHS repeat-associated protein
MPLAVAVGVTGTSGITSEIQWVHANHLGTPILTTNAAGAAVTPYGYAAIGFPGQFANALLLPGAEHYYNRYRDYDPTTGRYIQADPIGLAGDENAWGYAGANPVRWTDPEGLYRLPRGQRPPRIRPGMNPTDRFGMPVMDFPIAPPKAEYCPRYEFGDRPPHPSKCADIYAQIDKAVKFILRKELEQLNGRASEWKGHDKAIRNYARNLADLVRRAINMKCYDYNSRANAIIARYGS